MKGSRRGGGGNSWLIGIIRIAIATLVGATGLLVWAALAGGTQPYDTYESTVAGDGPVAQYRFDDAYGSSTLADSAGSYAATNSEATLGGEGPFGGSKSGLLASEAFATLPSSPLAEASAFTVEAWVYWDGGSSYKQPIFDFGSDESDYMYLTPASGLSEHQMLFEIRAGSTSFQVTAPTLTDKAWEYVAVSESGSGTLTLYLNGEQVGQTTGATISPSSLGSTPDDYLGKSLIASDPFFDGRMSNVAFYATELSSGQLKAHYDAAELPVNTTAPTISGTPTEGNSLSATTGSWSGKEPFSYTYQWQRCNLSAVGSRGSGAGQFGAGEGIAVDSHNDVWVSDTYDHRLEEFNEKHEYVRTVGSQGTGPGQLEEPEGIAITAKGDVLVTDWANARVEEYNETGEYIRQFGTAGSGLGQLINPFGIAVDHEGNVLVDDTGNNRFEEFSENGEYISAVGSVGTGPGQFNDLSGIAIDPSADILAIDSGNNRLEKFNEAGEYLTSFGSEGSGDGQFRYPEDVAIDASGHVWVMDTGNDRIEEFSETGEYLRKAGSEGSGVGEFGYSPALATDASGDVWVMDSGNERVDEYGPGGDYVHNETCVNIMGATSSTYVLRTSDVGLEVRVIVAASNTEGETVATGYSSAITRAGEPEPPTPVLAPVVEGTSQDDQTLTVSTGTWTGTEPISYSYRWQKCDSAGEHCTNISGATSTTYSLGHGDVGSTVRVVVTATNAIGSESSTSEASAIITPLAPSNTAAPTIIGTSVESQTLSASTGTWSGTPTVSYTYQWQKCDSAGESCSDISGATTSNYVPLTGDVGSTLRVTVSAANAAGSASSTSLTTSVVRDRPPSNLALPTVSGIPRDGWTLTARTGAWESVTSPSYAFQWQRCEDPDEYCSDISGATSATYVLSSDDVGSSLRVVVTATNSGGSTSSHSESTGVIEALALSNTTLPSVSGIAEEGQTLTAGPGSWTGTPPIAYEYQWQSCDSLGESCLDLAGATSSTYTLRASDVGTTLRALVTAANGTGQASMSSSASTTVAAITSSSSAPSGDLNPLAVASGTVAVSGFGVSSGSGFGPATIEATLAGEGGWGSICGSLTPSPAGDFKCLWNTASGGYPQWLLRIARAVV